MMAAGGQQALLQEVVTACRLGMEGMAGDRLTRFVDRLQADLSALPLPLLQRLVPLLGEMLAAQERQDLLGVADLLQYEMAPLLPENMGGAGKTGEEG